MIVVWPGVFHSTTWQSNLNKKRYGCFYDHGPLDDITTGEHFGAHKVRVGWSYILCDLFTIFSYLGWQRSFILEGATWIPLLHTWSCTIHSVLGFPQTNQYKTHDAPLGPSSTRPAHPNASTVTIVTTDVLVCPRHLGEPSSAGWHGII